MLRAMANEWAYPLRKVLQFAVRWLYVFYKLGKITRRFVPLTRKTKRQQVLELVLTQQTLRKEDPEPMPGKLKGKSKPEPEELDEDMDLSEIEDMDLGDLDIDLDPDDLEDAAELLDTPKKGKKGNTGGGGVSDEALLTLTKEIRDNNTQVLAKVESTGKAVKGLVDSVATILENFKKLFAFLKQDSERQKEDVKKTKEILNKTSAPPKKAAKVEVEEEEDEEEEEEAVDKATANKIAKLYEANWKKFSSVPKFSDAVAGKLGVTAGQVHEVLRGKGWVGRGGKCKDPAGE